MLVELNIQDEQLMDQCYEFLCDHSERVKQLFGMALISYLCVGLPLIIINVIFDWTCNILLCELLLSLAM